MDLMHESYCEMNYVAWKVLFHVSLYKELYTDYPE